MPVVSVVIPVYNAEPYLAESLDGVLSQTLRDIEVLCVDDGSTDGSAQTLARYAANDSRLKVITQANRGAGAARNHALESVQGEYVVFLDADDLYEPRMLEAAVAQAKHDAADIVLYGAQCLDCETGKTTAMDWLVRHEMLPETRPFSPAELGDFVFMFTTPAPWNKLFRRDFVLGHGLRFQEIRRANDLRFSMTALALADSITVVDEVLVTYRVGTGVSLQSTNHETPTEFYEALLSLRANLQAAGRFEEYERSYINAALGNSLYTLRSLKRPEAFKSLYNKLRTTMFEELGIVGRDAEYFLVREDHDEFLRIMALEPEQYIFENTIALRGALKPARAEERKASIRLREAKKKLKALEASRSYRIGNALARATRLMRRVFVKPFKRAVD